MRILMLGNGFDLYHKLPTTYSAFLSVTKYLVNKKSFIAKDETVGNIFSAVKEKCKMIDECYKIYGDICDSIRISGDNIGRIAERCRQNKWWCYFSDVFDKEKGWVDFEREIQIVIDAFSSFFQNVDSISSYSKYIYENDAEKEIISRFDFFFQHPSHYILSGDRSKRPNSIERFNDNYLTNMRFSKTEKKVNRDLIVQELYSSLDEFSGILVDYYRLFVEDICSRISEQNPDVLNKNFAKFDTVVSFNYTNTYEVLYSESLAVSEKVFHIHGSTGTKVVLGINSDENDLPRKDTTFILFKKFYQRAEFGTDLEFRREYYEIQNQLSHDNAKNQLYVVGHSLDITDEDMIKRLFVLADQIIVFYHEEPERSKYLKRLTSIFGNEGLDSLEYERQLSFRSLSEFSVEEDTPIQWISI